MQHWSEAVYCPACGTYMSILEYGVLMCECEEELALEGFEDIEEEIEDICRSLDQ